MPKSCFSALIFFMAVAALPAGQNEIKFAVVDMSRVIEAHPDTGSGRRLLEEKKNEFELEQDQLVAELEKLKDEFDSLREAASNTALSAEVRNEKQGRAREKLMDLGQAEQKARRQVAQRQEQLSDLKTRMHKRVVEKIDAIVEKYASEHDIELVLDSSAMALNGVETVLYFPEGSDITGEITGLIEKEQKSEEQ
ncbi:MAG: OmpH family outer membrane protein [Kiritimatiellia bacterium]